MSDDRDDALLALLYATGELDGEEAAAFERRLADDQAARDALCTAVRLNWATTGRSELVPDPAYRERVKKRVLAKSRQPFLIRSIYRMPWSARAIGGAAAAALVLVSIYWMPRAADAPDVSPAAVDQQLSAEVVIADEPRDDAEAWPDLMGGQHLARAVDDEHRRKGRTDERRVVRVEDRATQPRGAPIYRQ
jgi:anti-sigma factor RsiW